MSNTIEYSNNVSVISTNEKKTSDESIHYNKLVRRLFPVMERTKEKGRFSDVLGRLAGKRVEMQTVPNTNDDQQ